MYVIPKNFSSQFLIVANACIALFFVVTVEPASASASAVIAGWLLIPHLVLLGTLIAFRHLGTRRSMALRVLSVLVSTGGTLFLAYLVFGPTDAQNAIGVFATPVIQAIGFACGLPFAFLLTEDRPENR